MKIISPIYFLAFLLACSPLCGTETTSIKTQEQKTLRIYICSRLTPSQKKWNNEICKELDQAFILFRPQDVNLEHLNPIEVDSSAYREDFEGMQKSDLLLVFPPYGRDCAWEIGWFCGHEKPAIAYAESSGDWMRDAMVKGGLKGIITNNTALYKLLLEDPSTKDKCHLISSRENLPQAIEKIFFSHK